MRTTSRLAACTTVLGGALLFVGPAVLATPAWAQTVTTPCPTYPFDCPTPPGGGGGGPSTSPTSSPRGASGSGGGSVDNPSSLPFTGGELTLVALAGAGAIAGGAALVSAGRKRAAA